MKATLLIALALLGAACGSSAAPGTDGTVSAPADGRLVVTEQGKEPCCYVEGYIRFLRIESGSGTVFDGRWEDGTAFTRTLPAGEYRVTRYLRPCDGNCTLLDPPSERCSIRIPVGGPGETHLRALPQALGSCRLAEAG